MKSTGFWTYQEWQLQPDSSCEIKILGVQVVGTILNKNLSTGGKIWGLPWAELPPSIQVYGIGDIRFGYMLLCSCWHHDEGFIL